MCRLRIPNGILKHWQFAGVADLAERYAGGYAHVTTRANLQMREVEPKNAVAMVESILDLGLCSRGSGADNIRNVTGTPTAGIDPQELIDTRPYAREWHFHILNERALYGIPRKFNVGFDGGGLIPVLEDTNDIGFQAVVVQDGFGVAAGVWIRLRLGGITGPRDFGRAGGDGRRRGERHRGARPLHQHELDPRRSYRLYRERGLQIRRLRHQASRRGDRALVRGPRRARQSAEHPSHRLPSFLRAA